MEEVCVGTLNALGDAFNPFEFLNDDQSFMDATKKLQDAAVGLQWETFANRCDGVDVSEAATQLKEHCDKGESLWSYFGEDVLVNDNKLLQQRFNLITFAMMPHGADGKLSWELLDTWQNEVQQLVLAGSTTYTSDANMLVWDCVCNVVASLEPEAYLAVCKSSPLNPENFEALAGTFMDAALAAAQSRPLVFGLQEWPLTESPKLTALYKAIEQRQLKVHVSSEGSGVAIVYSSSLGEVEELTDVMQTAGKVMQGCLDAAESAGEPLDKKGSDGAKKTTARKTLLVRFSQAPLSSASSDPSGMTFMVGHAKEPKSAEAARVLAKFMMGMGGSCFVGMIDANTANAKTIDAMSEALSADGFDCVPATASSPTTAKTRSILHGQCYDKKKCNKLVVAAKDHIIAPRGMLSEMAVHPNISEVSGLPSPQWGSDHALLTAIVTMPTASEAAVAAAPSASADDLSATPDGKAVAPSVDFQKPPPETSGKTSGKESSRACMIL